MQEPPRPRRGRSRRRPSQRPRPTQAPAEPQSRVQPPAPRERAPRDARRGGQRGPQQRPPERKPQERPRGERGPARRGRGRPRQPAGERTGTPVVILLDNREGEPDLTGAIGIFEGYFDFETGDRRGPGEGLLRLKVGNDRIWGFECWWRADPARAGLKPDDHEEIEASKRLLRGLLREGRRPPAFARRPTAT